MSNDKYAPSARTTFLFEALASIAIVGGFITLYILKYGGPTDAVSAHLIVLSTLWAFFLGVRLLASIAPCKAIYRRLLLSQTPIYFWLFVLAWYAIICVGLSYWGRVTTVHVAAVYFRQVRDLAVVLGVPFLGIAALGSVAAILPGIAGFRRWPEKDWVTAVARGLPSRLVPAVACLLLVAPSIRVASLIFYPPVRAGEPFSLSLFPELTSHRNESHSSGETGIIDHKESVARAQYKPLRSSSGQNVILIVSDALRPDHLGAYGYSRGTSPYLDNLAGRPNFEVFHGLRSSCAESSCGLISMASSRDIGWMPSQPLTLQEVLRRSGYRVDLILGGDHTNFYGLKESYGEVDNYFDGTNQKEFYVNDDSLVLRRIEEMPKNRSGHPIMLQIHLMSTHALGKRKPESSRYFPSSNYYAWPGRTPSSNAAARSGINYYDNGVAEFDAKLSEIIAILESKGYLDHAILVLTADHGEVLGEHKEFSHGHQVYEENLRIPLIIGRFGYNAPRLRRRAVSSQTDIAPTILHELGIHAPKNWTGVALQEEGGRKRLAFQQGKLSGTYEMSIPHSIKKILVRHGFERGLPIRPVQ